jgi:peptide deformylase
MAKQLCIYTVENPNEKTFLRKVSKDITKNDIQNKEFQSFLDDLIFTAENVVTEEGYTAIGLSAIQVGRDQNVFCFLKENTSTFELMLNPKIDIIKPTQSIEIEGCLSIPKVEGKVARFTKIKVTYLDRKGKRKRGIFKNLEAREIQHEYDHTKGVLFTDKVID